MTKLKTLILLTIVLFSACSKDSFETGVEGNISYGEGDCMPIIDYDSRVYESYNGGLLFIVKEDLDSLGNGDFDELKSNSISTVISHGKLSVELPIGTYMVMPVDMYLYSNENIIDINSGEILNKDFCFWKCTSY